MTDSIKPVISPDHGWHGVLTNDYGAEIEVFGSLEVVSDKDGTRWAYPPVQYTRADLTDAANIREAALREAYEVVYKWWFDDGNALPQELILALIGEKK